MVTVIVLVVVVVVVVVVTVVVIVLVITVVVISVVVLVVVVAVVVVVVVAVAVAIVPKTYLLPIKGFSIQVETHVKSNSKNASRKKFAHLRSGSALLNRAVGTKRMSCAAQSDNMDVLKACGTVVRVFVNNKGPFVDALTLVDSAARILLLIYI